MPVLPKDRTIPLLIWLFILSCTSIWFQEDIPIVAASKAERLKIGEAQLEDFMSIPRMQVRVAKQILKSRDQLKTWEDLRSVRGVGPKTLEQLKARFVLN